MTVAAWTDRAIALEMLFRMRDNPQMSWRCQPELEECATGRREAGPVIGGNGVEMPGCDGCQPVRIGGQACWYAAIAKIAMGQGKTGFPVVVLLVDDPVEPDGPCGCGRQRCFPELIPDALTANGRIGDIEAQKGERRPLLNEGHAGHHLIVLSCDPEPRRIGSMEAVGIAEAGVPAFTRGPVEHGVEIASGGPFEDRTIPHGCLQSPAKGERIETAGEIQQCISYRRCKGRNWMPAEIRCNDPAFLQNRFGSPKAT